MNRDFRVQGLSIFSLCNQVFCWIYQMELNITEEQQHVYFLRSGWSRGFIFLPFSPLLLLGTSPVPAVTAACHCHCSLGVRWKSKRASGCNCNSPEAGFMSTTLLHHSFYWKDAYISGWIKKTTHQTQRCVRYSALLPFEHTARHSRKL